jgi:predicted CopG family antitoxin
MAFKTITIKEEVYEKLLKAKGKDMSFSEFLEKSVESRKPDLMKFYGAWDMGNNEWKRIERILKERRRSADKNFEERVKRLFE